MNDKIKYDPEDLESLLTNKTFEELYPEERDFVLKHLDSAEEYASLRETLHAVLDSNDTFEDISPRLETKTLLMQEFEVEEKAGFKIWLNSLFASWNMNTNVWYQNQGLQLGFATVLILLVASFFYFNKGVEDKLMADNISHKNKQELNSDKQIAKERVHEAEVSNVDVIEDFKVENNEELDYASKSLNSIENDLEISMDDALIADVQLDMDVEESSNESGSLETISLDAIEMNESAVYDANHVAFTTSDNVSMTSPATPSSTDIYMDTSVLRSTENLSNQDFAMGNAIVKEELTSVSISAISIEGDKKKNKDVAISTKVNLNDYSNLIDLLYTAP